VLETRVTPLPPLSWQGRRPHSASIELIERAPENSGAESPSLSRVRRAANSGEQSWSIKPHSTASQPAEGTGSTRQPVVTGEVVQASETAKAANQMENCRRLGNPQCANMTRGVAHAR